MAAIECAVTYGPHAGRDFQSGYVLAVLESIFADVIEAVSKNKLAERSVAQRVFSYFSDVIRDNELGRHVLNVFEYPIANLDKRIRQAFEILEIATIERTVAKIQNGIWKFYLIVFAFGASDECIVPNLLD